MKAVLIACAAALTLTACDKQPTTSGDNSAEKAVIQERPVTNATVAETGHSENKSAASPVQVCYERGVAYFKEIGSYPTLSTKPNAGQAAEEVALERCERNPTAF